MTVTPQWEKDFTLIMSILMYIDSILLLSMGEGVALMRVKVSHFAELNLRIQSKMKPTGTC